MFSLEATLHAISEFFIRLYTTFYHSFFRVRLFFQNLDRRPETYTSPRVYLFLSMFIAVSTYKAMMQSENFLGFLEMKPYQGFLAEVQKYSVFDIILASAPYAVISYLIILLITKALLVDKTWKPVFIITGMYYLASQLLLLSLSFVAAIIFLNILFNFLPEDSDISFEPLFIAIVYVIIQIVILLLPSLRIFRLRSYLRAITTKFSVLYLLMLTLAFLNIYLFTTEEIILNKLIERKQNDPPIRVYNAQMKKDFAIVFYELGADSVYTVKSSFIVENRRDKACYLSEEDDVTISIPVSGSSNYQFIVIPNKKKSQALDHPVQIINPNAYEVITFAGKLDAESNGILKKVLLKSASVDTAFINFDLKTVDPEMVHGFFSGQDKNVRDIFDGFTGVIFRKGELLAGAQQRDSSYIKN